ncbi:DNA-processing protein DprA [Amycolatopsis sp. NPDC051716]|uniref:DNA-processing protein DprA n=1 Tax=Amycolatopsis sp. NPDC051716 TaxID=3155804 RepID=UPI00343630C8
MTITDELRARLFLLRATEPPAPAVYAYVAVHGPVDATARIRGATAPPAVLAEITRPQARIEHDLRAIEDGDARLLTPEDEDWPLGRLGAMGSLGTPLALWVRGDASLTQLTDTAVALTGTRWATGYGNTVAADFGYDLARAGVTVVGGGSAGVDESAHRAALTGEGRTVVVLPCGVDQTYPQEHARLYGDVIERGGLLVSEHPTGALAVQARLAARCRLLAALTSATVIVEAGQRSFALATARAATALGRRVYGVPGSIHSTNSKGVNELLRTGAATAVTSVQHINYQERLR